MDEEQSMLFNIILIIILMILNIFLVMAENAIINVKDSKLKQIKDKNKKTKVVFDISQNPSNFIGIISMCNFFVSFGIACMTIIVFSKGILNFIVQKFDNYNITLIYIISFVFIMLGMCSFVYIFCYDLPKKLVKKNPEKIAYAVVGLVNFIVLLFKPLYYVLSGLSSLILKIFRIETDKNNEQFTEEEILMLVNAGNEKGVIEKQQKDMIENVFEFENTSVGEIMTHRTDIISVSFQGDINELVYIAMDKGFSRIPIYKETIDDIIGLVYVKDLLCLVGNCDAQKFNLSDFIRNVLYVPETTNCSELFKELQSNKAHMAVVVDEYGGTAGIVTMEDLLESIVGNIQDEYDNEKEEITQVNDNTFTIDGSTDIEEVEDLLGVEFEQNNGIDTLGGLIINELGRIPEDGETPVVIINNIEFTVLISNDKRINKVKVIKLDNREKDEL